MAFYIRKSVSLGPLRFNLSKSGIGVSAGIRGLRVGTGPRGNYVHIGRGGLYYRQTLATPSTNRSGLSDLHSRVTRPAPASTHGPMEEIASGRVSDMVDSNSAALLAELDRKRKKVQLFPIAIVGGGAGMIALTILWASGFAAWMVVAGCLCLLFGIILAHYRDLMTKSVVMMYDLDDEAASVYRRLHDTVASFRACAATWHLTARGDVYDPKYHAGAGELVRRKSISVAERDPPFVRTNVSINCVPLGCGAIYLCPDTMLVFTHSGVGAIGYGDLRIEYSRTRFIEDGIVPRDAKVVDRTWRYVNKRGGPDRRFKDNRELPICEYEEIHLSSATGLNEVVQVSRVGIGTQFEQAVKDIALSLHNARREQRNESPARSAESFAQQEFSAAAKDAKRSSTNETGPLTTPPPTMEQVHEALLRILCCVMVSDGRASSAEKSRIVELMRAAGALWDPTAVGTRMNEFIREVQDTGYKAVCTEALSRVSLFRVTGREDMLLKSVDLLAKADEKLAKSECVILRQIQESLQHSE